MDEEGMSNLAEKEAARQPQGKQEQWEQKLSDIRRSEDKFITSGLKSPEPGGDLVMRFLEDIFDPKALAKAALVEVTHPARVGIERVRFEAGYAARQGASTLRKGAEALRSLVTKR